MESTSPLIEFQAELARYKSAQTALGNTVEDEEAIQNSPGGFDRATPAGAGRKGRGFELAEADLQSRMDMLIHTTGKRGTRSVNSGSLQTDTTMASFRAR